MKYSRMLFGAVLILALLCINMAFAVTSDSNNKNFECLLTINKAKDWHKQTLVIEVVDFNTKQVITTLTLPGDDPAHNKQSVNTLTQSFNCGLFPETQLVASYDPPIWSSNKGKTYESQGVFKLEDEIAAAKENNAKNLQITVEFPSGFVNVPDQINIAQ